MCANQIPARDTFCCRTEGKMLGAHQGQRQFPAGLGKFSEGVVQGGLKTCSRRKGKIRDSRGRNHVIKDVDAFGG